VGGGGRVLEKIRVGQSSVTYSEPGEYYSFVMGIPVSRGPREIFFYQLEFIMVEVFPEMMPRGQN